MNIISHYIRPSLSPDGLFYFIMAGRKDKNTVDYFPHYCKSGKTLFILENKFGNDGYAVWFKILELLGSNDNHYINCNDLSNWEFLQAQMRVSENKLTEILNCLSNLNAIHTELWDNKIIWSSNFVKNINDAYLRRKTECMQFYDLCSHLSIKCKHKYDESGIVLLINTQSIVKDIKVEEMKEKTLFEKTFDDFLLMRKNIKKVPTERAIQLIKDKLIKLSNGKENIAIDILNRSILNNWQDVFPLTNNHTQTGIEQPKNRSVAL